jgi:acyl-CoA thioesterase I
MTGWNRRQWTRQCIGVGLAGQSAWSLAASPRKLLVVGDSLSAEYGLARGTGWVALLEARLHQQKKNIEVVNASISGDTTAGGRARLAPLLAQHRPAWVVIELGGNDALRGMPLQNTRDNLVSMVRASLAAGSKVLLVGMQVPPNYGSRYAQDFFNLFAEVAKAEKIPLVPFLLSGFATKPDAESWFQSDRIHPLAKAHPLMLDAVWPVLSKMLQG